MSNQTRLSSSRLLVKLDRVDVAIHSFIVVVTCNICNICDTDESNMSES